MPIYEFVCEACGRLTEVMQKVGDPSPASCPECGGGRLARLVSRTSFQLKGGGWYSDLYGSPKTKPAAPDAKPEAKPDGKPEAKPDAKPAAPAPATGGASSGSTTGPGSGSGGGGAT